MQCRYLLDTNIASYIIKGNFPAVRRRLVRHPMPEIAISSVTEGELWYGVTRRPDATGLRPVVDEFLRAVTILDNPSAGNYEELGLLYIDDGNYARAKDSYDKAISSRTDHVDPFYRRGVAEIELVEFAAAVPDLERAVSSDPDYDFHRAKGLLAWAYAQTGQIEKADAMFREATRISTISETYYHYALFLQAQGRAAEARVWSQKILDKKPTMPRYLRRRERPWFRKASALLGRLPARSS